MIGATSTATHRHCWKLLPWYVNGTLETVERIEVEEHLEDCPDCRQEIEALGELRRQVHASQTLAVTQAAAMESPTAASRGLRQVLDRIADDTNNRDANNRNANRSFWPAPPVRWVLAAQMAAILVLTLFLAWPSTPQPPSTFPTAASYTTLSDPRATTADADRKRIRIVFSETATELELRHLLRSVGAEIIAGPSSVGAYTLQASPDLDGDSDLLTHLRSDPLVRLAESLTPR